MKDFAIHPGIHMGSEDEYEMMEHSKATVYYAHVCFNNTPFFAIPHVERFICLNAKINHLNLNHYIFFYWI